MLLNKEADSNGEILLSTWRGVISVGAVLLCLCQTFLWVMIETIFICHAEASAGSQCEFTVLKKNKLRKLRCRLPTDRKEGTTTLRLDKTFIFNSSSKATPFILRVQWKYTLHAGKKGELELSRDPPPFLQCTISSFGPNQPPFLCYLFGFRVAHTQWGWLSEQMVLSVRTGSWSWDKAERDRLIRHGMLQCDPEAYWSGRGGPWWDRAPGTLWRQFRVRHKHQITL